MLLHLMGQSGENDCSCLASAAVIPENLHNAMLKAVILNDFFREIVRANHFRQDLWLEFLRLEVMS